MRIHHIGLKVRDMEAALKFYLEILGFTMQETVVMGGQNYYFVGDGSVCLEIEQAWQTGLTVHDNGFSHLAIEVEDLETYCQRLRNHSVIFQLEPSQFRPDRKIAFIEDTEGNAIQLIEFLEIE